MNEPTSGDVELNCLEHGADIETCTAIEIRLRSAVSLLARRIRETINASPASQLSIYICPNGGIHIDDEDKIREFLAECTTVKPAHPGRSLATLKVSPKPDCIHIVYKLIESPMPQNPTPQPFVKRWYINGAIHPNVANQYYCVDPLDNQEVKEFTEKIYTDKLLLLTGARASGKTTRSARILEHLSRSPASGLICLRISLEDVSTTSFWCSLGATLALALKSQAGIIIKVPQTRDDIKRVCFDLPSSQRKKFLIFIDEFNELFNLDDRTLDEVLRLLRSFRDDTAYNVCIIGVGTFSIRFLTSENVHTSPFNLAQSFQNPNLSLLQVHSLFNEFGKDNNITFEDGIIQDIYFGTNGHAGLISLIGTAINGLIRDIIPEDDGSWKLTLAYWFSISFNRLHDIMDSYNTFKRLRDILLSSRASASMEFLRKRLLGSLDPIIIDNPACKDASYAKFLVAEGVLTCSNTDTRAYKMSSPYLDSLLRRCVIPHLWPSPVSRVVPSAPNGCADVYAITKIAIKYFDGEIIRGGYDRSYKRYKRAYVPRESVYDTEMMRILVNWLPVGKGLTVTGQWHLVDNGPHYYSDIIVSNSDGACRTVIELLASGTKAEITSHITKMPNYQRLLNANNALIIHFTTDPDPVRTPDWRGVPIGIDIAHVYHNREFSEVIWSGLRWMDGKPVTEVAIPIELE